MPAVFCKVYELYQMPVFFFSAAIWAQVEAVSGVALIPGAEVELEGLTAAVEVEAIAAPEVVEPL